jgi:adenine/guanine phosphoribosyltransferase-like PRPP-binding protein
VTTTADERKTWSLLARGGVERRNGGATKYNGLADPIGAEELGRALAAFVRELAPTAILVWEEPEDVLIAHIVGRELSLPAVRAFNAEGLVGHSAGLPQGPRVVLIGDAVRDLTVVRAVRALTEKRGGSLVGTVVLVETPELRAAAKDAGKVRSLVRVADASAAPDGDGG